MRTIIDYRLGGEPVRRIVSSDREALMRLPDEVQKCVVFLGQRNTDKKAGIEGIHFLGTAFFVGVPLSLPNANLICLVTARHVAENLEHGEFCIRANTKNGGSETYWLGQEQDEVWWHHPTDASVDCSVLLWAPPEEVDFKLIPKNMFLDQRTIVNKGIGSGDDIFITGLFTRVSGTMKNLPIVRTGNVAMIPPDNEKIPVKWNSVSEMNGYLIEARSIGGLSGSPVFVQRSIEVQPIQHSGRKPLAAGAIFWLGLIHGHWDATERQIDSSEDVGLQRVERVNMGIAIVVPTYKILETICQPGILNRASEGVHELLAADSPITDGSSPVSIWPNQMEAAARFITRSAAVSESSSEAKGAYVLSADVNGVDECAELAPPATDANPNHREDFTRLVNAAGRKREPKD